jgi:hypothetical protein
MYAAAVAFSDPDRSLASGSVEVNVRMLSAPEDTDVADMEVSAVEAPFVASAARL